MNSSEIPPEEGTPSKHKVPVIFLNEDSYLHINALKLKPLGLTEITDFLTKYQFTRPKRWPEELMRDVYRAYELALAYPVYEDYLARPPWTGGEWSGTICNSKSENITTVKTEVPIKPLKKPSKRTKRLSRKSKPRVKVEKSDELPQGKSSRKLSIADLLNPQPLTPVATPTPTPSSKSPFHGSQIDFDTGDVRIKEEVVFTLRKRSEPLCARGHARFGMTIKQEDGASSLLDSPRCIRVKQELDDNELIPSNVAQSNQLSVCTSSRRTPLRPRKVDLEVIQRPVKHLDGDFWFYYDPEDLERCYSLGPKDVDVVFHDFFSAFDGVKEIPENVAVDLKELFNLRLEKIVPVVEKYMNFFDSSSFDESLMVSAGRKNPKRLDELKLQLAEYKVRTEYSIFRRHYKKHPGMSSSLSLKDVADMLELDKDIMRCIETIVLNVAQDLGISLVGPAGSSTQSWKKKPDILKNRIVGVLKRIFWKTFGFDGFTVDIIVRRVARRVRSTANNLEIKVRAVNDELVSWEGGVFIGGELLTKEERLNRGIIGECGGNMKGRGRSVSARGWVSIPHS